MLGAFGRAIVWLDVPVNLMHLCLLGTIRVVLQHNEIANLVKQLFELGVHTNE